MSFTNFSAGGALYGEAQAANNFAATNPDLITGAPSLAVDALNSPNAGDAGTALTAAASIDAAQQALDAQKATTQQSWWQSAVQNVMDSPIGTGLQWLNKPLQELQDDYKFIHAVWTHNGALSGLLVTLGVAGGAALGTLVGEPLLGGGLAATLERRLLGENGPYKLAYALSTNPNYTVSFGRDLANLMQAHGHTDDGWGQIISGLGDAAFDFGLDPVSNVGKSVSWAKKGGSLETHLVPVLDEAGQPLLDEAGNAITRSVTASKIPLAAMWPVFDRFLQSRSISMESPDQIDAVFHGGVGTAGPIYRRALEDWSHATPAQIQARYPGYAGLASMVAGKPIEEINDVLKRATYERGLVNLINGPRVLPARALTRSGIPLPETMSLDAQARAYGQTRSAARLSTVFGDGIPRGVSAQAVRTFSGLMPFHVTKDLTELDNKSIDTLIDAHAIDLTRMMRWSMSSKAAQDMTDLYLATPATDTAARKALVVAMQFETLKAMGLADDHPLVQKVLDLGGKVANGTAEAGRYDHGFTLGEDINEIPTDRGVMTAGIWKEDADTSMSLLNYTEAVQAMRELHVVSGLYGKVDQFAARYYTNLIFKPLALLRPAFALRVAMGEQIQSMIRYGATDMVRSKIASTAIKSGYKLSPGEIESLAHSSTLAARELAPYPSAADNADNIRVIQNEADPTNFKPVVRNGVVKRPMQALRTVYGPGLMKMARTVAPDDVDLAAWARINMGDVAPGATKMSHGYDSDLWRKADNVVFMGSQKDAVSVGRDWHDGMMPGGDGPTHTTWGPADPHFLPAWHLNLSKRSQNPMAQQIMRDYLSAKDAGLTEGAAWQEAEDKMASTLRMQQAHPGAAPTPIPGTDPYQDAKDVLIRAQHGAQPWAHAMADGLRNSVTGADGTLHRNLAEMVARGEKPDLETMDAIDPASYPKGMAGRRDMPYIGRGLYDRIVTGTYGNVLGPIVDSLSREPLFIQALKVQRKTLQYAVQQGHLTSEEANWIAAEAATKAILPQIHNPMLRSQFSVAANNYLPFYFAQEQAYKRFARLALTNPEMIRRYQMIYAGLANSSFIQTDSNGGKHVMLPGVGAVGSSIIGAAAKIGIPLVAGLPLSGTGAVSSLQSVLPETNLPGVSPILGMALDHLSSWNPALHNIVNHIDPYAKNTSLLDSVLPSSPARDVITAITADEGNIAFANAQTEAMRAAYNHGDLDHYETASPQEQQATLDRITNNARSVFIFKAMLGLVSPLAPSLSESDQNAAHQGLRQEFLDMYDKALKAGGPEVTLADGSKEPTYTAVIHKFLAEHGTKSISYTVASTIPTDPGYIPLNDPAIKWVNDHWDLVKSDYGLAASFLVPQTNAGGDVQAIQDELLKDHLRSRATPKQFMEGVHTAAGNNAIAPSQQAYVQFMKTSTDPHARNQVYNAWQQYQQDYGLTHPLWWANYGDSTQRQQTALRSVQGLLTLLRDGPPALTGLVDHSEPQVQLVTSILNDWMRYEASAATQTGHGATALKNAWVDYLHQRELDVPALAPIIRSVFLPLGG